MLFDHWLYCHCWTRCQFQRGDSHMARVIRASYNLKSWMRLTTWMKAHIRRAINSNKVVLGLSAIRCFSEQYSCIAHAPDKWHQFMVIWTGLTFGLRTKMFPTLDRRPLGLLKQRLSRPSPHNLHHISRKKQQCDWFVLLSCDLTSRFLHWYVDL